MKLFKYFARDETISALESAIESMELEGVDRTSIALLKRLKKAVEKMQEIIVLEDASSDQE